MIYMKEDDDCHVKEKIKKRRMKTSSVRSQQQNINPFKKSCTSQTQTKNKKFAKKVDDLKMVDLDDRKTAILFHMKTRSYDCCSTYSRGSFIANEGAGFKCTRTFVDLHCTTILFKDERETKERDRKIVDI